MTTTAITPHQGQQQLAASTPAAPSWSREQVDVIRNTVARGASDAQLALFLQVCATRQLDPFTRQVHWTPQGIIAGIDGLRAIADRTDRYVPGPTAYETDAQGALVAAHVTVRKLVAGAWHDITESAFLAEYLGRTPIWKAMPRVMLAKCAEARALRRAFPSDLSGIYAQDEMDQAGVQVQVNPGPAATVQVSPAVPAAAPRAAHPSTATPAPAPAPAAQAIPVQDVVDVEAVPVVPAVPAAKPDALSTLKADVAGAPTLLAARKLLEAARGTVTDAQLVDAFQVLLGRCATQTDTNDAAQAVVTWKKAGMAGAPVDALRTNYLARKAELAQAGA